jgi:hypothetical protein
MVASLASWLEFPEFEGLESLAHDRAEAVSRGPNR